MSFKFLGYHNAFHQDVDIGLDRFDLPEISIDIVINRTMISRIINKSTPILKIYVYMKVRKHSTEYSVKDSPHWE